MDCNPDDEAALTCLRKPQTQPAPSARGRRAARTAMGWVRGAKDVATIMQRLGRAKQRYARAAQHYVVEVAKDATGALVSAITWTQRVKPGSAAAHPGVYCPGTARTAPAAWPCPVGPPTQARVGGPAADGTHRQAALRAIEAQRRA